MYASGIDIRQNVLHLSRSQVHSLVFNCKWLWFLIASTWCALQSYSETPLLLGSRGLWMNYLLTQGFSWLMDSFILHVHDRCLHSPDARGNLWTREPCPRPRGWVLSLPGNGEWVKRIVKLVVVNLCKWVSRVRMKMFPENKFYQKATQGQCWTMLMHISGLKKRFRGLRKKWLLLYKNSSTTVLETMKVKTVMGTMEG